MAQTKTLKAEDVAALPMPTASTDLLTAARNLLRTARDKELEAIDLEQRLATLKGEINEIKMKKLVDLFSRAGIKSLSLDAEGNTPAYSSTLKPYYKASISADWPLEQQDKAYDYLETQEPDLIKRQITVDVGRDTKLATRIKKALAKLKTEFSEGRSVHHGTLTKWLKEVHQKTGKLPQLDLIGATVGQIVDVKPTKEKT